MGYGGDMEGTRSGINQYYLFDCLSIIFIRANIICVVFFYTPPTSYVFLPKNNYVLSLT